MFQQEAKIIDRRIAEEVMGWTDIRLFEGNERFWIGRTPQGGTGVRVPRYSEDIAAAMTVVEHLRSQHHLSWGMWATHSLSSISNRVTVGFTSDVFPPAWNDQNEYPYKVVYWGYGEPGDYDPALAICRAALAWANRKKESESAGKSGD